MSCFHYCNFMTAFVMRTFPSSADVQGATYFYYPVVGYNFKTALTVHNFHSQGSIACRAAYHGVTGKYIHNISFTSYRVPIYTPRFLHILPVPIYTPGWRAAMWIKCFAEGQKCQALTGIKPATLPGGTGAGWETTLHMVAAILRMPCDSR